MSTRRSTRHKKIIDENAPVTEPEEESPPASPIKKTKILSHGSPWMDAMIMLLSTLVISHVELFGLAYFRPAGADKMVPGAKAALAAMRSTEKVDWNILLWICLIAYSFFSQLRRKAWRSIRCGIYGLLGGLYIEQVNGLVLKFTNYAPIWLSPPRGTQMVIFAGWTMEIMLQCPLQGLIFSMVLPKNKDETIAFQLFGKKYEINNRKVYMIFYIILAVVVELFLGYVGLLEWHYPLWCLKNPIGLIGHYIVAISGFLSFYDTKASIAWRYLVVLSVLNVLMVIVYVFILGWV